MVHGSRCEIGFVVVTFNSERYIRACIESIYRHPPAVLSFRVVVVDNASSDGTLRILAELQREFDDLAVISPGANVGFGLANNLGFAALTARYYVLVNHDARLIGDSVSPVISALQKDGAIAICGLPLVFPDGSPQTYAYPFSSGHKWLLQLLGIRTAVAWCLRFPELAPIIRHFPYGREFSTNQSRKPLNLEEVSPADCRGAVHAVDWVCAAAMVIDGEFLGQSRGFDPAIFLYGEDEDLCIAAQRQGRRVVTIDTMPVVHDFGWGRNRFNRAIADHKYISLVYFIQKNVHHDLDRILMRLLLPFHVYGFKRFFYAFRARGKR
jgi:hypothetical protein